MIYTGEPMWASIIESEQQWLGLKLEGIMNNKKIN